MPSTLNAIIKNYFSRDSLEALTETELEDYIRQYPYTALGHFLLAKKKKTLGRDYQAAASLAVLYFHNPLWFEYLLNQPVESLASAVGERPAPIAGNNTEPAAETIPASNTVSAAAPPDPSGPDSLFEPFHTIDYFASQGIRLRQADLEQDQFGRQLKSFTDWLKSMKRVGDPSAVAYPAQQEEIVEKNAISSINTENVETEAMADVWLKQGNVQKAMEIYRKLSLQNPSKSHYFADKIAHLKE